MIIGAHAIIYSKKPEADRDEQCEEVVAPSGEPDE